MIGVVLAGGTGSRLYPLTYVCNKSLLPVYDRPMIYWPIKTLVDAGIDEIVLVCGGNSSSDFFRILQNGEDIGVKKLHYAYQSAPRGIADALRLAKPFTGDNPITVILGDNIFEDVLINEVNEFKRNPSGAYLFGKKIDNPCSYGVAEIKDGKILGIEEKPKNPKSDIAVTGCYIYDNTVWDFIDKLEPSARGELEITDVNNYYVNSNSAKIRILDKSWIDCGESIEGYYQSCTDARRISLGL